MQKTSSPRLSKLLAAVPMLLALSLHPVDSAANVDIHQQLATVPTFAMGHVGLVGHISDGERLFHQVRALPDARAAFNKLIFSRFATPEAKTYALCGLHEISTADFDAAAYFLRPSRLEVSVLRVDILRKERLNELLGRMAVHGCR